MPDNPPKHRFTLNEHLLCRSTADGHVYEAKIAGISSGFYTVHYPGWAKRYDETIPVEDPEERLEALEIEEIEIPKAKTPRKRQNPNPTTSSSVSTESTVSTVPTVQPEDVPTSSTSSTSYSKLKNGGKFKKSKLAFDRVPTEVCMTPQLVGILIDDYKAIQDGFITKIPARFNIDRIIKDYIATIPVRNEDLENIDDIIIEYEETDVRITNLALICTANGIKDYCNFVCGSSYQLLYDQERQQHGELIREKAEELGLAANAPVNTVVSKGFEHSSVYGIIHLVRLLSRLPQLLPMNEWDPRLLHRIMIGVHDLLVFLNKNWHHYHTGMDMYVASAAKMEAELSVCQKKKREDEEKRMRRDASQEF